MTWLDALREFLSSLMGDVPLDFDEAAQDAIRDAAPEQDGEELLRWLATFAAVALAVTIVALIVVG